MVLEFTFVELFEKCPPQYDETILLFLKLYILYKEEIRICLESLWKHEVNLVGQGIMSLNNVTF